MENGHGKSEDANYRAELSISAPLYSFGLIYGNQKRGPIHQTLPRGYPLFMSRPSDMFVLFTQTLPEGLFYFYPPRF